MKIYQDWLNEFIECKNKIIDSNFENFIEYKKLFKLIYEASNNMDIHDYKKYCHDMGISPLEAKNYCIAYEKIFKQSITEYKISDELAKKAKSWDKSIWIEFSKIYHDGLSCRKALFYTLITGKLKYGNTSIPIDHIKLCHIKKFKQHVLKFNPHKGKKLENNFKSIRTRLNNFINKDLKSNLKSNKELMQAINNHYSNLFAILEEHLEQLNEKVEDYDEFEDLSHTDDDINKVEIITDSNEKTSVSSTADHLKEEDDAESWKVQIQPFIATDIYKLYNQGSNNDINWGNPYYAVLFLGLDIFNLPSPEAYRKKFKELVILFHPDNKKLEDKPLANQLLNILNDINLNIWGANGERYCAFINAIKFSMMKLGVGI